MRHWCFLWWVRWLVDLSEWWEHRSSSSKNWPAYAWNSCYSRLWIQSLLVYQLILHDWTRRTFPNLAVWVKGVGSWLFVTIAQLWQARIIHAFRRRPNLHWHARRQVQKRHLEQKTNSFYPSRAFKRQSNPLHPEYCERCINKRLRRGSDKLSRFGRSKISNTQTLRSKFNHGHNWANQAHLEKIQSQILCYGLLHGR